MAEALITVAGALLIAALAWFFFGPRKARGAELRMGRQEVEIAVKGGYSPNLIRVREGVPLRLVFDRQEAGDCTSRVVFPDFGISRFLAPFARTALQFTPERSGEFGFACGMNMVHGTLLVEPDRGAGRRRPHGRWRGRCRGGRRPRREVETERVELHCARRDQLRLVRGDDRGALLPCRGGPCGGEHGHRAGDGRLRPELASDLRQAVAERYELLEGGRPRRGGDAEDRPPGRDRGPQPPWP